MHHIFRLQFVFHNALCCTEYFVLVCFIQGLKGILIRCAVQHGQIYAQHSPTPASFRAHYSTKKEPEKRIPLPFYYEYNPEAKKRQLFCKNLKIFLKQQKPSKQHLISACFRQFPACCPQHFMLQWLHCLVHHATCGQKSTCRTGA